MCCHLGSDNAQAKLRQAVCTLLNLGLIKLFLCLERCGQIPDSAPQHTGVHEYYPRAWK